MGNNKKVRASRRKYHYIYKTTCLITNKYYIGMHSTDNMDDGYKGSGTILAKSIRKYGDKNHHTEVLEFLSNRDDLRQREKEIINEEIIADKLCMNLQLGGGGGFSSQEHEIKFRQASLNSLNANWKNTEYSEKIKKVLLDNVKKAHANGNIKYDNFKNKTHTPETIAKMKSAKVNHGVGKNNSQYGSMWITNGFESKKINKNEDIPTGWKKGRKISSK